MPHERRLSPNHDARGIGVDMLILHYTGMTGEEAALHSLSDPDARVGTHWFVRENGGIVAMIDEGRRAWHAGVSCWAGETDINARSIGIEIHNPGHEFGYRDFPDVQIEAVVALCREILARHPIAPWRVLAHSDVAPARKMDPGERFPWQRLHAAGIGHWVAPAPLADGPVLGPGATGPEVRSLQGQLLRYGYGIEASGRYDAATEQVVTAFQRHFRPERVDGLADPSTCETLNRLLAALAS